VKQWARFVAVRLAASLSLVVVLMAVVFVASVLLIPGDFATQYRLQLTPDQIANIRTSLAIDQPWWEQLRLWLGRVFVGDLGTSFSGLDVTDAILDVLAFSLLLLIFGVGLAFVIGISVGSAIGWNRRSWTDSAMVGVSAGSTLFPPWLAFLAAYLTAQRFGFGPFSQLRRLDNQLWTDTGVNPSAVAWAGVAACVVVGFGWVVGALVGRRMPANWKRHVLIWVIRLGGLLTAAGFLLGFAGRERITDMAALLVLPVVAIAIVNVADTTLLVATITSSFRAAPFVLAGRAKGLSSRQVLHRHVRRVTLLPILSRYVASLPVVLGGLVIMEEAFGSGGADLAIPVPGLSSIVFYAVSVKDMPLAMGALLVVGLITVVARLLLDVAQAALDPRYLSSVARR
jgi:peptide/nickel transport system permease protein